MAVWIFHMLGGGGVFKSLNISAITAGFNENTIRESVIFRAENTNSEAFKSSKLADHHLLPGHPHFLGQVIHFPRALENGIFP